MGGAAHRIAGIKSYSWYPGFVGASRTAAIWHCERILLFIILLLEKKHPLLRAPLCRGVVVYAPGMDTATSALSTAARGAKGSPMHPTQEKSRISFYAEKL